LRARARTHTHTHTRTHTRMHTRTHPPTQQLSEDQSNVDFGWLACVLALASSWGTLAHYRAVPCSKPVQSESATRRRRLEHAALEACEPPCPCFRLHPHLHSYEYKRHCTGASTRGSRFGGAPQVRAPRKRARQRARHDISGPSLRGLVLVRPYSKARSQF
jgi:hypothetical protein